MGVRQGSCLGPLLLTIYASKLFSKNKSYLPSAHLYADDNQLYLSFRSLEGTCEAEALDAVENCITDVRSWIINDKLVLNDDNTEFLVIGTSKQVPKVSVSSIRVGDVHVIPLHSAKKSGFLVRLPHGYGNTYQTCASASFYLYNVGLMAHVLGN